MEGIGDVAIEEKKEKRTKRGEASKREKWGKEERRKSDVGGGKQGMMIGENSYSCTG